MSVMTFGAQELSNVAAVILNGIPARFRQSDRIRTVCAQLALISVANTACFADKYKITDIAPVSAREIERALVSASRMPGSNLKAHKASAISTARLLRYNCIDDGGDFLTKFDGAALALAMVLEGLLASVAGEA